MFGAVRHAPFIYTDAVLFVDLSTSLFFAWMLLHTSLCPSAFLKKKEKTQACVCACTCVFTGCSFMQEECAWITGCRRLCCVYV